MPAIVLVGFIRKIIQTLIYRHLQYFTTNIKDGDIYFDTLKITFTGLGYITIKNRSERILVLFLSIFFMLASMYFCGDIYKQIATAVFTPTINSLETLNESNINIFLPYGRFDENTEKWLRQL